MNDDLRRNKRRTDFWLSFAAGLAAFLCTLCLLVFALMLIQPAEISAALDLAGLPRVPSSLSLVASPAAPESPAPVYPSPTPSRPIPSRTATAPRATPTRTAAAARPTLTPLPRPTLPSPVAPNGPAEHFLLARPVPPDAVSTLPSWYYLYGATENGALAVHHGVEFANPTGTAILAAADGTVEVAGNDSKRMCGDNGKIACGPDTDFYGNLVVVRLDLTYYNRPIYILHGHMNSIAVSEGQRVHTGDKLGEVGETGVAQGPHLHFEVRVGVNDYAHTRDPLLWLKPLSGYGMLAGRVLDRSGRPAVGALIDLYDANSKAELEHTETYGRDSTPPVNPDDDWKENFALGDLKAETFLVRINVNGANYYQTVTIVPGHTTFIVQQAR